MKVLPPYGNVAIGFEKLILEARKAVKLSVGIQLDEVYGILRCDIVTYCDQLEQSPATSSFTL